MNRRNRFVAPLALLATCGLGAGACTIPKPDAPTPVEAVGEAKEGGVVSVAITPPGTIDPAAAAGPASQLVVSAMCDTLVTIDVATGDPRPGLVESWIVGDGGRSISFKLRRGLRFSDGSSLTSKEVVASLRRLADPATAGHAAGILSDLAGFEALTTSVDGDARKLLRGARVIEPLSFEVTFERGRHPDFVRALAHPATSPVRADLADRAPTEFAAAPTCAGPYRPTKPFTPGETTIELARDPRARGTLAGAARRGAGFADTIRFVVLPDEGAAYDAWRRGEVDIASVPPDRLSEARSSAPSSLFVGPAPDIELIGVPAGARSPFPDAESRRVLAESLDRDALVRDVYGGSRAPATGFLPPSLGRLSRPDACRFAKPAAPSQALAGRSVTLTFNDEYNHRKLAEAVAGQWRERLALDVQLVPMPWDQYLAKVSGGQGVDGLFRMAWSPRFPSGLEYLGPLFTSGRSGGANLAQYSDLEFDRALEFRAAAAEDEREQELELWALEDRVCAEVPLIPIAFGQSAVVVRSERILPARADGRRLTLAGAPLLRELFVR